LTSVTIAPGTAAPVESETVPVNPPVVDDCAHKQETPPLQNTIRKTRNAKASPFKFIVAVMCLCWPVSEEIIILNLEFELCPH